MVIMLHKQIGPVAELACRNAMHPSRARLLSALRVYGSLKSGSILSDLSADAVERTGCGRA